MDWSRISHFTPGECACSCCGRADMDVTFIDLLDRLRDRLGFALPVTSGFRCHDWNAKVGGGIAHTTGKAADIHVTGERALALVGAAIQMGVNRIGLRQHGPMGRRFVHLDICTEIDACPSPAIWTYDAGD